MKTPLEALDEAIRQLKALREIVVFCPVACHPFSGMVNKPIVHFYRPSEECGESLQARALAGALGGNWTRGNDGMWETTLCCLTIFIHNAEPARNPQPEAVDL